MSLKKTPLHDLHLELNARMVSFAGYHMPLQYDHGIIKEHRHCREAAGLFDISHMGQITITGTNASESIEKLVPGKISNLLKDKLRYTVLTNERGGIIDDCIISNVASKIVVVSNGARKHVVLEHLQNELSDCEVNGHFDQALLALQGPASMNIIKKFAPKASDIEFMSCIRTPFGDFNDITINRCGYSGEDGFELAVSTEYAEAVARLLLSEKDVQPIGLGARDTLRLEAGLCLYGQDIDETTTPVEAGLTWLIAKDYLENTYKLPSFPGAETILQQLRDGPKKRLVGIKPTSRVPVRPGTSIVTNEGAEIGEVTSGGFGPSVNAPIALAYVQAGYSQPGSQLNAVVRGKTQAITVETLPFIPHKYYQ